MTFSLVGHHIGQYRVLERHGHGSMGTVYRAFDETLERDVALKVLGTGIDDPQKRIRAEAITLARLRHAGIATVYELFQHEGHWVMVMEFVQGETLEEIIDRDVLPLARAAELCMETLMAHAHAAGVVHRDLKPSNLMVTADGTLKILDFGIARLDGAVHLTHDGFMVGTPAYMAPEQVLGGEVDERADLYAVGVIFYRLVTGQLPFRGETALAMAQAQVTASPIPVHDLRPDAPVWVDVLVNRALAKAPGERFRSAREFHDAFAGCLQGLPLPASALAHDATEVMMRPTRFGRRRFSWSMTRLLRSSRAALWLGLVGTALSVGVWRGGDWNSTPPDPAGAGARPQGPTAPASGRTGAAGAIVPTPAVNPGAPSRASSTGRRAAAVPVVTSRANNAGRRAAALPAIFRDAKLLLVNGRRTTSLDVLLTFSDSQLLAAPSGGSAPVATVPYDRITKATYAHAKDPRWDPGLSAPAETIDVPGVLGRPQHWLVVQTDDAYTILQLSGNDWPTVLKIFKDRTGVTVDRPATTP